MSTADVAVWRVPLDPARAPDARALDELSRAELDRAALFATDDLRHRWLHAHVALRRILARALDVAPASVAYAVDAMGKPHLASPRGSAPRDGRRAIEFNLSDSGDLALVALSHEGPVGVDVERCRPHRDLVSLAESFFAPEERAALAALPAEDRSAAFFRIWARKEAFIKAIGLGLGFGLTRFAVSSEAQRPALLRVDPDPRVSGAWTLADVAVPEGYAAALVTRAPRGDVVVRDWIEGD